MNPQEKFNDHVWRVLNELREKSLYAVSGQLIQYAVAQSIFDEPHYIVQVAKNEIAILIKLEEWGALKIINQHSNMNERLFDIRLDKTGFDKIYDKYEALNSKVGNKNEVCHAADTMIRFEDNIPALLINEVEVPLPPYKKEHYLCRALWRRERNESIDWSIIYNEMENRSPDFIPDENKWRYVYDSLGAVHKRLRNVVGVDKIIFEWKSKTIKRLY